MDYSRQNEIQGSNMVFFKSHALVFHLPDIVHKQKSGQESCFQKVWKIPLLILEFIFQESTPVMTETSATGTSTGLDDNMVSSSSQEPRTSTIAVQTPSKLLKDLIAGSSKISKEELRQLKEKVGVFS